MSLTVSSIVEVSMKQNNTHTVNSVRIDDWTAEWALIAGNGVKYASDKFYL